MAILNYNTEVPPERTIGEITAMLIRKGARSITTEYSEGGDISAVSFVMKVGGLPVAFLLPANVAGVAAALQRDFPLSKVRAKQAANVRAYKERQRSRARWIAWRILKDWIAAQMALIESNQAEAAQVFMPFACQENRQTMFEVWQERNRKQLTAGSPAEPAA